MSDVDAHLVRIMPLNGHDVFTAIPARHSRYESCITLNYDISRIYKIFQLELMQSQFA